MNYWKEFKKSVFVSLTLWLVLLGLSLMQGNDLPPMNRLTINLIYTLIYTITIYFANAFLFKFLDDKFTEDRFSIKRLIIGFIVSIPISVLVVFVLTFIDEIIIQKHPIHIFFNKNNLESFVSVSITTFVVSLIIHFVYLYKAYQETKLQEQKVIAGTASAQFESLKNQIDPHFLFNSLNVLSSLIEENPDMAQKFTTSLSKVYRYVLDQRDKELVTVDEELAFAKTYMNLLKMRFENSITFQLPETVNNDEAKVVPLSLQLLLENCIKHNVVSEKKPLHIKISIENNELVIENNLQKKEVLSDRKGVGLDNIVNRYAILTKRHVKVENNENYFRVYLPILTKKITTMESQIIYNENLAYEKARDRVKKIKDFYGNLTSYIIVISALIFINLMTSREYLWFFWPAAGWGFGVIMHAIGTFGIGKDWEERKIQEIMNKENNNKNWN